MAVLATILTITNNTVLPKLNFPSGIWVNGNATNISETELFYLDGVTSNIQTQLNSLSSQQSTNTSAIGTNSSNISALQTQQSTNTSNISSLTSQQSQNTSAISTNTSNISSNTGSISSLQSQQSTNTSAISSLQSQQSTNTGNISTNSSSINSLKTKYDFTGTVANGKLLIGSGSNYTVGELASSDNTVTITQSAGGIDLVVPSSSSLSAGTGINITANNINYDIEKETAYTTPASADTMLMFDSANSLTKKITFSNFNSGLQSQITSNDTDITNLTTQQNTNTSAIATNTSNISSLTTQQNTNTSAIATNTSNISSLTTQQNTNTSAIATNTSNISSLTTQQNTNTSAIATNTSNISSLTTQQNTNTSAIATNTSDISSLTTQQNTNTSAIATNTSNISSLTTQQSTNTSNISSLTTQQNTNTSAIATNTSAIANIASPASSTNFGTTASAGVTLGNNSQTLALNSASMNAISAGKHFFRSNLTSGLGFEVQGYNSGSPVYHSVLQVHNVSSGFPYLSFLTNSGFQTSQLASKSVVIDANGRLDVGNLPQTLTGGTGITLNSSAIDIDFLGVSNCYTNVFK